MSPTKSEKPRNDRDVLYDHWMSIPAVSFINIEKNIIENHISRPAILRILRKGIKDPDTALRRHALNVKEIKSSLAESGIKMSITGLYFHLKVLLENNLIQVVATLPAKRHRIAYYGRISRHILMEDTEERVQKYERRFAGFAKFAKTVNPKMKLSGVKSLARQYVRLKRKRENAIVDFIEKYEEAIDREGIDPYVVYEFLKMIDVTNSDHSNMLSDIVSTFKIDPSRY